MEEWKNDEVENSRTLGDKVRDLKAAIGRKKDEIYVWCGEHKELVAVCAPVIITGTFEIIKASLKKSAAKHEEIWREDYIYDRSNGHYYELKHIRSAKKRNKKYLEIDRRRYNGEPLGEILKDMKMLK